MYEKKGIKELLFYLQDILFFKKNRKKKKNKYIFDTSFL